MFFNWFDAREAKAFGMSLAQMFMEKVPLEAQLNEKKFAARMQDVLQKMAARVRDFRKGAEVNLYKKAQLGNAFKWALRDSGYDEAYVEKLTLWLMTQFK